MKDVSNPFFVEDQFHTDLSDWMMDNDIEELDDVNQFEEDWTQEIHPCSLQKMFDVDERDIEQLVDDLIDMNEDRIGENDNKDEIMAALKAGIDLEKINAAMPNLWYPDGSKDFITKQDLLDAI